LLIDIIIRTVITVIRGADYILNLKSNQWYLKENNETIFKVQPPVGELAIMEKGHGRIVSRKCRKISDEMSISSRSPYDKRDMGEENPFK